MVDRLGVGQGREGDSDPAHQYLHMISGGPDLTGQSNIALGFTIRALSTFQKMGPGPSHFQTFKALMFSNSSIWPVP